METSNPQPSEINASIRDMDLVKEFFRGGKESVFVRTSVELTGPVRSFTGYLLNRVSGGLVRKDLNQFFAEKEEVPPVVEINNAAETLKNIDRCLTGENGVAENFIGKDYRKWSVLKEKIENAAGRDVKVSDYALFGKDGQYLFITRGTTLIPVKVGEGFNETDLKTQFEKNEAICEVPAENGPNDLERSVGIEIAIGEFARKIDTDPTSMRVRRMSSVTNDFLCQRHKIYEREGEMFTNLRHMGVSNLGELQGLNLMLFSRGVSFDEKSGQVIINQDLANLWEQLRMISCQNETPSGKVTARDEMEKYAREKIYFESVKTYFKENPQTVDIFLKSPQYLRFAMEFRDKNLSAIGLTERDVAENMLANYYLSQFEGGVENSNSQTYLADITDFHESLKTFIESQKEITLPLPYVSDASIDQLEQLTFLFSRLKKQEYSFTEPRLSGKLESKVSQEAVFYLDKIKHQIRRHGFEQALLKKLGPKIIVMPKGLTTTAIANAGLARVPDERCFTIASWLPWADGYIPKGETLDQIPKREQTPTESEMSIVVKDIFSGKVEKDKNRYVSQENRIVGAAPLILAFLQKNKSVPENVRNFMNTITSPELAVKLLERFDSISDNDPLIVNRFFPEGFADFQISATYRYVYDFIRGVETNIILTTSKSLASQTERRLGGRWKNNDFSGVDEIGIQKAIENTLYDASHRIKILNHEAGTPRKTLTDYQDFFEKAFGWDTHDMKYLRWEKMWDVWNTLGATWDCICFSRKTVFNPRTFQQW